MIDVTNTVMSGYINGLGYVCPPIRKVESSLGGHLTRLLKTFNGAESRANAGHISLLAQAALQPIKYLFLASLVTTGGCYLAGKYTPIFSSVFKVLSVFPAFFSFDMFVTYVQTYKEYLYFEGRSRENNPMVNWEDFMYRVNDYSRTILASTFVVGSVLSKDLSPGLQDIMRKGKDNNGEVAISDFNNFLPGIKAWFGITLQPPVLEG